MKTIIVIVATLFVTLFMMAMPVHAEWSISTSINRLTDEETIIIYTQYKKDNKIFSLEYSCEYNALSLFAFDFQGKGLLGKEYQDETYSNKLLIRFDKEPAHIIYVHNATGIIDDSDLVDNSDGIFDNMVLMIIGREFIAKDDSVSRFDRNMKQFLSKMKKHQILSARIQIQSDDSIVDEYIIVEFDISGFDEVYDSHCG